MLNWEFLSLEGTFLGTTKNSRKFKVTQGSFWSLREDFLTERVATLIILCMLYFCAN